MRRHVGCPSCLSRAVALSFNLFHRPMPQLPRFRRESIHPPYLRIKARRTEKEWSQNVARGRGRQRISSEELIAVARHFPIPRTQGTPLRAAVDMSVACYVTQNEG